MALLRQIYRQLVNLPIFSSCFRKSIESFIKIFEISIEYVCCEATSADDIASSEAARYKILLSRYI